MVTYYESNYILFEPLASKHQTKFQVIDGDTFSVAKSYTNPCCLCFASKSECGGGYEAVMDLPMPIKTQEEDLFRRSTLPQHVEEMRQYYPLEMDAAIYCKTQVIKDSTLKSIDMFEAGVVLMPAVINPMRHNGKMLLVKSKMKKILSIMAEHQHENIILGAWGCGVFNNDPRMVAEYFKELFGSFYAGVFKNVVFAIPAGVNNQIFSECFSI